jgi:thiol-disulfide isomerase/thioredoxin
MGTPAARVEFEKGQTAQWSGNLKSAVEAYRRAIELDPDFAKAHEGYIFASQLLPLDTPESDLQGGSHHSSIKTEEERRQADAKRAQKIQEEYVELAQNHPDRPVYQWALGIMNQEAHPQAAERYARNALQIDPAYAPAFNLLASIDEARGELNANREDLRNAVAANPANPEYLFNYAYALRDVNPPESLRLMLQVVDKFPESDSAPSAFHALEERANTPEERVRYLEMLKAYFPPSKTEISEGGMMTLFGIYDRIDSEKALALAEEMEKDKPKDTDWALCTRYEQRMISAERLLADGNAKGAVEALSNVELPWYVEHARLDMLRARAAQANGETARAYTDLVKIFASEPTDDLQVAITGYGQKLGKSVKQVVADVSVIRDTNAKPASPFSLKGYGPNAKRISLSDFKGRVVLVNFWFPECGPCRQEFPYLKAIYEKYKSQGLVVISINIVPAQDDLVLSSLRGYKLDFVPARDDDKTSKAFGVRGVPENYIIGADGRLWFHPDFPISDRSKQRILELEVEALVHLKSE